MKDTNKVINFYNVVPANLKKKVRNPNYSQHLLNIPFRMCIVGSSGSMKSNTILNIIHKTTGTFDKILLCCKNADETLYNYLKTKINESQLMIIEGIEDLPEVDEFADELGSEGQMLAIFDDLMLEKDQSKIEQFFIRGRKIGGGISSIYCSQSWFKCPITIRRNINYIILKKINSKKDITQLLKDFSFDITADNLKMLYDYTTKDQPENFMLIDLDNIPERRFRKNFLEILEL